MDKSWIGLRNRTSKTYKDGVNAFLSFAYTDKDANVDVIYCPCSKCRNRYYQKLDIVKIHIEMHGFDKTYVVWNYHGENVVGGLNRSSQTSEGDMLNDPTTHEIDVTANMVSLVQEGMGFSQMFEAQQTNNENIIIDDENLEDGFEDARGSNEDVTNFYKRLKDAESELYENCPKGVTELSFVVELLNIQQINNLTNKSITQILKFLKKIFPFAKIPKSYYLANKLTTDLGFNYVTRDACPNSCMLFWKEASNLEHCEICGASRYKSNDVCQGTSDGAQGTSDGAQVKRVAEKQARYWPLKQALQRLFWSTHTAPLMKWHKEKRIEDGVMRHPADSLAWKRFDQQYPSFARESRNVRLGLSTDGFNPFGNMSSSHSTWPIVLIPYNLPPWLCMKESNFILSVLIDGPKGPLDNIDVYLQPLVEELKELWEDGISTYDVSTKQFFQLKASLLWTISDFPAYANLSGWSTKSEFACPVCNKDCQAIYLKNGSKFCYWGHRRFLPPRHRFRNQKTTFNGKLDTRPPPRKLTGSQLLKQLNDHSIETVYKKEDVFRKRKREQLEKEHAKQTKSQPTKIHNWKKKSIFWELPYWEHNVIRHNLDVMHVEKNVCDNVLFTLLGAKGKTKDNLNARKDLIVMNIRHELHPHPRGANLEYMPHAEYTMTNKEKELFLKVLKDVRVPDGYSSNIPPNIFCVQLADTIVQSPMYFASNSFPAKTILVFFNFLLGTPAWTLILF